MNAEDILKYGHQTVLQTIEGIADHDWNLAGACGVWSMREIVAHLASYEHLLEDILSSLVGGSATPTLSLYLENPLRFNDDQVATRSQMAANAVVAEYVGAHERTMALIRQIPTEVRSRPGTLPWYGAGYALDDVIVYMYYGHKREHSAQIAAFRDRLRAPALAS